MQCSDTTKRSNTQTKQKKERKIYKTYESFFFSESQLWSSTFFFCLLPFYQTVMDRCVNKFSVYFLPFVSYQTVTEGELSSVLAVFSVCLFFFFLHQTATNRWVNKFGWPHSLCQLVLLKVLPLSFLFLQHDKPLMSSYQTARDKYINNFLGKFLLLPPNVSSSSPAVSQPLFVNIRMNK